MARMTSRYDDVYFRARASSAHHPARGGEGSASVTRTEPVVSKSEQRAVRGGHRSGTVFELSEVSRGAAFGDLDNDGDMDVVVSNNGGPVRLLLNNVGNRNRWLGLRLVGGAEAVVGVREPRIETQRFFETMAMALAEHPPASR